MGVGMPGKSKVWKGQKAAGRHRVRCPVQPGGGAPRTAGAPALIKDEQLDERIYSCKTQSFPACSPSCSKCPTAEAPQGRRAAGKGRSREREAKGPDINPIQTSFPKPQEIPVNLDLIILTLQVWLKV